MDDYIVHSANQFGINFINTLPSSPDNVVFSPWSIINLLGMVLLGTKPNSKSSHELHKALLLPGGLHDNNSLNPHQDLLKSYKRILSSLTTKEALQNKTVSFKQGNLILYNQDLATLNSNYVEQVKHFYNAGIENFSPGQSDHRGPLHQRINSWVSNITHGMITDMAEPSISLDKDLVAALLNADYFSGKWQHVFKRTKERDFYNNGKEQEAKRVEFVRHDREYEYVEFDVPVPVWVKEMIDSSKKTAHTGTYSP